MHVCLFVQMDMEYPHPTNEKTPTDVCFCCNRRLVLFAVLQCFVFGSSLMNSGQLFSHYSSGRFCHCVKTTYYTQPVLLSPYELLTHKYAE